MTLLRPLSASLLLAACLSCTTSDGAETEDSSTTPTDAPSATPSTEAASAEVAAKADASRPKESVADGSVYALAARTLAGEDVELDRYDGKVTLFVNVASKCGYTRQYAALQALHEELGGEGFAIVGVPSNDFGGQEPGTADEIAAFCSENYGVTFDMLEKQGTKEGNSALFDRLAELTGERPTWNFCKYVVSPDGTAARFFASAATPGGDEVRAAITELGG